MTTEATLRRRIKLLTWFFIVGLFISGATAIPLKWEVDWLANFTEANFGITLTKCAGDHSWGSWLFSVQTALDDTNQRYPFLFYGTDWLAFGHFMIALAFVGALRNPVRNRWLFDFGLIACVLVIPFALIFGGLRGIPIWWRLIDCSFGIFGFIPLWFCRKWSSELEQLVSRAKVQ